MRSKIYKIESEFATNHNNTHLHFGYHLYHLYLKSKKITLSFRFHFSFWNDKVLLNNTALLHHPLTQTDMFSSAQEMKTLSLASKNITLHIKTICC